MTMFKVTAPAGDYNGKVGDVQFADGCAEIDDERNPMELDYCRNAGYLVEPVDGGQEPAKPRDEADDPFDPGEHTADDVLAYLDTADEAEAVRVLDAEAAGKKRKGITGQRDQILTSKKEEEK